MKTILLALGPRLWRIGLLVCYLLMVMVWSVGAQAQTEFSLRGIVLHGNKKQVGATVAASEGARVVQSVVTDARGKFELSLPLNKNYSISFLQKGLQTKQIRLSTVFPAGVDPRSMVHNLVVVLNTEGTAPGAIPSYRYNPSGNGILDYELEYSAATEAELKKVDKNRQNRQAYEGELQVLLNRLDPYARQLAYRRLDSVKRLVDSVLLLADIEARHMLQAAKAQSSETLREAAEKVRGYNQLADYVDGEMPTAAEIEKFYVDRQQFLVRKDIQQRELQNRELKALRQRSREDSLRLMENALFIRTELVKTARYQLEIDRLNAKTHNDSVLIAQKEAAIQQAEQEIDLANTSMQLQRAEIRNKNFVLIGIGLGSLLLAALLGLYVQKTIERTRLNNRLTEHSDEITRQNQHILASIQYARNIQTTILPPRLPLGILSDAFILFRPKDIVSGDFYWYHQPAEGTERLYVAVVDCTGHGVPGAFMSLIGNRLLNEIVREEHIVRPADILAALNRELVKALQQESTDNRDGMDMALCMIEPYDAKQRRVVYAGAKRSLMYIDDRTRQMQLIKGSRKSIGGIWEKGREHFDETELLLPRGSLLYLSSDGFVDQNDPQRRKYGSPRLHHLLENSTSLTMTEQLQLLQTELDEHQGTSEQRDDITLLGLRL